jgi:hypothetical protein
MLCEGYLLWPFVAQPSQCAMSMAGIYLIAQRISLLLHCSVIFLYARVHLRSIEAGHLARLEMEYSLMKRTILASVAVLSLGVGTAFAQGKPPGEDPGTAPQAFPNEPYHTGTVFSELFHGIFGSSKDNSAVANRSNDQSAAPRNGG